MSLKRAAPSQFEDEQFLSAGEKGRVLRAWQRFIRSGFEFRAFSQALYRHLIQHCAFIAHYDRLHFWQFYFDGASAELKCLLNQFGGNRRSCEYGWKLWLDGPAADLKRAMCAEMAVAYPAFIAILAGLDREFGQRQARAEAVDLGGWLPGDYRLNGPIRQILARAAQEAYRRQKRKPAEELRRAPGRARPLAAQSGVQLQLPLLGPDRGRPPD
jgi:hypothetical protein